MQGWARNATEETNEELRRFRKEIGRSNSAPLRIMIAGDPTKPVLSFTLPRRWPGTIAAAFSLCATAFVLGGWHAGAPPGAIAAGTVVQAAAMVESLHAERPIEFTPPPSATPPEPPRQEAPAVAAVPKAAAEEAKPSSAASTRAKAGAEVQPEAEQFTVEISNTGQLVEVKLDGPAGEPDDESYRELRHALRCQRTGAENPIDPRLVELLHQISVSAHERIQVVSAYRAPLHPRDLNYHVRGMGADIRVPGMSTAELRDLAKSLGANGVGFYPTVQFVHVDMREIPYFWTDTSGHNENKDETASTAQDLTAQAPAAQAPGAQASAAPLVGVGSASAAASALGLVQPPAPPPPPAATAILPQLGPALARGATAEKNVAGASDSHRH